MRTFDISKIKAAVAQYAEEIEGFDPYYWLQNPNNIALINDNDDVALFEHQYRLTNTVCGHYFFFSRGKQAVAAAQKFLEEIFSNEYKVDTIIGLTPENHKAALWMNRRLGFKDNGQIDSITGPCRFVTLTKQTWKDSNK